MFAAVQVNNVVVTRQRVGLNIVAPTTLFVVVVIVVAVDLFVAMANV